MTPAPSHGPHAGRFNCEGSLHEQESILWIVNKVGLTGLEPATNRLKVYCSTIRATDPSGLTKDKLSGSPTHDELAITHLYVPTHVPLLL